MIVAVGVAAAAAAVLGYFVSQKHVVQHLLHTRKPLDWLTFLDSFTRFLFYDYMTKPAAEQWHRWALRAVLASAVLVGVPRLVIGRRWDRLALLAGLAIGLGGFHFVVGPEHLMTEGGSRYGVVFVAPAVVAFACLLEAALAGRATAQTPEEHDASIPAPPIRVSLAAPALSAVFAGLMLSSMAVHWFSTFSAPGRETIWTFFDDGSEPFEAAYRIIAHDYHQRKPADLCRILAEDYWVSKPIEYYASWRPTFEVENVADTIHLKWSVLPIPHSDRYDIVAVDRLRQGGYVCLRTDSPLAIQRAIKSAFSAEELHSWVVPNINGRDVLIVYRLEAAPATNAAAPAIASGAPKTIR
jgi:hypothetical protein